MFVKYDVTLKEQSSIPVKRPITGNEDAYSKSLSPEQENKNQKSFM